MTASDYQLIVMTMLDKLEDLMHQYDAEAEEEMQISGKSWDTAFMAGKARGVEVVLTYLNALKRGAKR